IQYTGGTTGISKGCILSNFNLEAMAYMDWYWLSPPLKGSFFVNLNPLPLYHIYSFNSNVILNMVGGGTIILVELPSPANILKNINQHKPNYFPAVPAMIAGLNHHPDISNSEIKCIKVVMSGGSPLSAEVKQAFERLSGVGIVEGYGLSETTQILTGNPTTGQQKIGTVGIPFPDTDIRIVDQNDGVTEVGLGELGELIARGPQIMSGYWKNREETSLVLKDGWLYTGDIASMDEDGYITIKDRKKDVIICNGLKVYPNEVDNVLYSHPKILEACTIGVPDEKQGEKVKTYIVLKPEEILSEKEIIIYCREQLAPYKIPRDVEFVVSLPKTRVGKPNRVALRMERVTNFQKICQENF
ncbi:MAG: AMP-binding protein, partial [Eubacteriales bacterium]